MIVDHELVHYIEDMASSSEIGSPVMGCDISVTPGISQLRTYVVFQRHRVLFVPQFSSFRIFLGMKINSFPCDEVRPPSRAARCNFLIQL